ncbi:hypothetical protein V8C86DRAFT_2753941 [Haematococcus lacustris]
MLLRVCRVQRSAAAPRDEQLEPSRMPARHPALVAASIAASCLLMAAPMLVPQAAMAAEDTTVVTPPAAVETAYEQEVMVAEQKGMLNFLLQQQMNAKKAAIASQRQRLQSEVVRVEAELAAKLTQQKANVVGAQTKGDLKTAESAAAAATQLEEKQSKLVKVAAQISAQLDRMELLERARTAAARQAISRAAVEVDGSAMARVSPWLESIGKASK